MNGLSSGLGGLPWGQQGVRLGEPEDSNQLDFRQNWQRLLLRGSSAFQLFRICIKNKISLGFLSSLQGCTEHASKGCQKEYGKQDHCIVSTPSSSFSFSQKHNRFPTQPADLQRGSRQAGRDRDAPPVFSCQIREAPN